MYAILGSPAMLARDWGKLQIRQFRWRVTWATRTSANKLSSLPVSGFFVFRVGVFPLKPRVGRIVGGTIESLLRTARILGNIPS